MGETFAGPAEAEVAQAPPLHEIDSLRGRGKRLVLPRARVFPPLSTTYALDCPLPLSRFEVKGGGLLA